MKVQTQLGLCFVPFPGPSSSGDQVLGELSLPRWGQASYHLLCPSHSVSWVHSGSAVPGVSCVSSGELISGCDPPGGCHASRILGRLGCHLGACSQFGGGCRLWGRVCPSPSGSGCCLPPAADWPVLCRLALLLYSLSHLFCEWPSSALG